MSTSFDDVLVLTDIKVENTDADDIKEDFHLSLETCGMNSNAADITQDGLKSEIKQETNYENKVIDADIQSHSQSAWLIDDFKVEPSDETQPSSCYPSDENKLIKEEYKYETINPDVYEEDGDKNVVIKHESDDSVEEEIDMLDNDDDVNDKTEDEESSPTQRKSITVKNKYECDICSKTFTKCSNLKAHILLHNYNDTEDKPYQCSKCSKCFSCSSNLKKHKLVHSGLKKHLCDICGKRFTRASDVKRHKLIHSREKNPQ